MYIPRGNWYNFWNDTVIEGGKELWVDAPLESMPIFVKEGAIIPKYPVQQYVDELEIEELRLDVYYKNGKQNSIYYEDDHDGYDYKMGLFNLRTFKLTGKTKEIIVQQHVAGTYESNLKTMKIKFHGLPFEITSASVNNENVSLESIGYDKESNTIILQENFTDLHLISE